jgi:hypothetical protein
MRTRAELKAIQEHLQRLEEENGGRLTPDVVVKDARDESSPLHGEFEWDVDKAAMSHWIDTARRLIASVTVIVRTEKIDIRVPAYVRDPSAAHHEQGYVSVNRLRSDADGAREALVAEFSRAGDLLRRARSLAVALSMEDDVERIIDSVTALRDRVQHQPSAGH